MKITSKHVLFWDGIYSNWHKCKFSWNGQTFNCAEQAMMYMKAVVFGDNEMAVNIMQSTDPKKQKAMGRKVKNFDQQKWESVCIGIVTDILVAKFSQNDYLKKDILSHGNGRVFVEASPLDTVWGIGMYENDPLADDPANWKGKNYLGICLNNAYDIIKEQSCQD